ncbi:glycoside hydrolase family 97 protein [Amphiplicatus metriothermophilus]|nr:glycoside hydrolase family 97 protein [Amphiplicatus metriothermophilus]
MFSAVRLIAFVAGFFVIYAPTGPASSAHAAESVASPDGGILATVDLDADGRPFYRIDYRGETLIADSALGLDFGQDGSFGDGLSLKAVSRRRGQGRFDLPGRARGIVAPWREMSVDLADGEGRVWRIVFRAYDEGVAFRYESARAPAYLYAERTGFFFAGEPVCHGVNIGRWNSSFEGEYDPAPASLIRPHHLYFAPLVCETGGAAFAIAESDLRDYAGMFLRGRDDGGMGVQIALPPRHDGLADSVGRRVAVKTATGRFRTPWRVVMIADHPGAFIESTLVSALAPAPSGDFSWVRPGKSAWDWWNGPTLAAVENPGVNDETERAFIDFAAEAGLEYALIDEGWYATQASPTTFHYRGQGDVTRMAGPHINIPALAAYAKERGVAILIWAHWRDVEEDMDAKFALFREWGVSGIKVDFMDRNDQEMVDFYHRLLATAARHGLSVNLHGAFPPAGLSRTYPNYLTQEGVLGAEYNKWSRRITSRHNVTLAFTRLILGPMDYTPGGFRNVSPEEFSPRFIAPQVMTTRGQALAMYVVYESPLAMVADTPDAYAQSPAGFDFIRLVPTDWDETRFLGGDIGEYVVVARRKGKRWFVGAMTNEAPREIDVPLDFLEAGARLWGARLWQDGADGPASLAVSQRDVFPGETLRLTLSADGGAALVLEPQ